MKKRRLFPYVAVTLAVIYKCSLKITKQNKQKTQKECVIIMGKLDFSNNNLPGRQQKQVVISAAEKPGFLDMNLIQFKT